MATQRSVAALLRVRIPLVAPIKSSFPFLNKGDKAMDMELFVFYIPNRHSFHWTIRASAREA